MKTLIKLEKKEKGTQDNHGNICSTELTWNNDGKETKTLIPNALANALARKGKVSF